MEIKKYLCLLVFTLGFLSCKKVPVKQSKDLLSISTEIKGYQHVSYKNKKITDNNKVSIFEYNDKKITIEYNKYTYFGYEAEQFNLYRSSYDLDSGDLDLIRYDDQNTKNQIFLVELNDFSFRSYHIYTFQNDLLYYLGENDIDLSKIIEQTDKIDVKFEINQTNNNITIKSLVNNKYFSTENYKLEKPLNVYKKYNNVSEYTIQNSDKKINDAFLNENLESPEKVVDYLIFTKDSYGKLLINTKILEYIQNNTTEKNNSYTMALSKYVTDLIINYYDNKSSEWTEEELFKIIGYASNTTDPLFKKYWKSNFEKWNNGHAGYILGFCNTAYHEQIWNKLTINFKKNNYYNLPHLEDMVWYGSDFDKTGAP